jgi:hypothetical protein
MNNNPEMTWYEYIHIQSITFSMECTLPSGEEETHCVIEAFGHTDQKSIVKISEHNDCTDNQIDASINKLHTEVLHPYVYLVQRYLFANIQLHHSEGNEWELYSSNLLSIHNEAFTQGFQSVIFRKAEEFKVENIEMEGLGDYAKATEKYVKSMLDYMVIDFILRLKKYTNGLSGKQILNIIRAFVTGWNFGILLKNSSMVNELTLIQKAMIQTHGQDAKNNGYELTEYPNKRTYHITHSMLGVRVESDIKELGHTRICEAIQAGIDTSCTIMSILIDILNEYNQTNTEEE